MPDRYYGRKKRPRERGLFNRGEHRVSGTRRVMQTELLTAADDFDFNAAVLGATGCRTVVGDRICLALTLRGDAVGINTLRDQVRLDCCSATLRQLQVVLSGTDPVSVTDGDDCFEVDRLHLCSDLVEQFLAFRLNDGLVEVKEGVGVKRHLVGHRVRGGRFGNGDTVAAGETGSGGPESIAPAKFVGAILPNELVLPVHPIVIRLGLRVSDAGCRNSGKGDC